MVRPPCPPKTLVPPRRPVRRGAGRGGIVDGDFRRVPICGRIPDIPEFMEKLEALKDIPIWVFHGANDPTVLVENSELIVAKLRSSQGNVRYTVYPDAGPSKQDDAPGEHSLETLSHIGL